jgi:23S rRNA (uridine2552-2'-O)-methyltransferase
MIYLSNITSKIMTTFKKTEKVKGLKSNKKRTASSRQWLLRQLNDPFVAKARKDGYRSRAAFKLIEINEKFKLIKKGSHVLDLGAAPGGWCQVAKASVGETGIVVGVDLLEIDPITGVEFLVGNFHDDHVRQTIVDTLLGQKVNVILSDMAASSCGMSDVDHIRLIALLEAVYQFSFDMLKPGGSFVAKVLRGGTEHNLLGQLKQSFAKISHFKPKSSRQESSELYVIAQGFRPNTKLKLSDDAPSNVHLTDSTLNSVNTK